MLIDYISFYSTLLPVILGVILFNRSGSRVKIFTIGLIVTNTIESLSIIKAYHKENNLFLINLSNLTDGIFTIYYISLLLKQSSRKYIHGIIALFILTTVFIVYKVGINEWIPGAHIWKAFILCILTSIAMNRLSQNHEVKLITSVDYWILFSVLLYSSSTAIIFAASNLILQNHESALSVIWDIHSVISILVSFVLLYGYSCILRSNNSTTS